MSVLYLLKQIFKYNFIVQIICHMKRFTFAIISIFLSINMFGQELPDMLDFIAMMPPKMTIETFKNSYSAYIHPKNQEIIAQNETGTFYMSLFTYDGNPSLQLVSIDQQSSSVLIRAIPDPYKIKNEAYPKACRDFKEYMNRYFGEPIVQNAEESLIKPSFEGFAKDEEIKSSEIYTWNVDKNCFGYMGSYGILEDSEIFILTIIPNIPRFNFPKPNSNIEPVQIQNRFFNHIELGKHLNFEILRSCLNVSANSILVSKTSEGKLYQVIYNGYFGGRYWDLVEVRTVDEKVASISFVSSKTLSNKHLYDDLFYTLKSKYGEPFAGTSTSALWGDFINFLTLNIDYKYIPNMVGEYRHYVTLTYSDYMLCEAGSQKAINEL